MSVVLQLCSTTMAKPAEARKLTPLGQRILVAAEQAGFSQTSLERACHFSGGYLTKLLTRPQDRIDLGKLEMLCDMLSVRMHWLATGREPMREGGALSAEEKAMVAARGSGVTEDVFWFVRGRDRDKNHSEFDWLAAFIEEHKKRVADEGYARAAKRVEMSEARRNPPRSEPRRKRAKVA